jgi:hypothetical protein
MAAWISSTSLLFVCEKTNEARNNATENKMYFFMLLKFNG